jgi:hypothetical protein
VALEFGVKRVFDDFVVATIFAFGNECGCPTFIFYELVARDHRYAIDCRDRLIADRGRPGARTSRAGVVGRRKEINGRGKPPGSL